MDDERLMALVVLRWFSGHCRACHANVLLVYDERSELSHTHPINSKTCVYLLGSFVVMLIWLVWVVGK